MMKVMSILPVAAIAAFAYATPAQAHTPLCACYDNGDGTVLCEGGFSDGSSASGVALFVKDDGGKVVLEGKMNENSEFEFAKPKGKYTVMFDAGAGHQIVISSDDIVE
jgi:hypothetical protein